VACSEPADGSRQAQPARPRAPAGSYPAGNSGHLQSHPPHQPHPAATRPCGTHHPPTLRLTTTNATFRRIRDSSPHWRV
jgi:hypothetical protein